MRFLFFFLIIAINLFSCKDGNKKTTISEAKYDSTAIKTKSITPARYVIDTIYKSDNLIVYGDTTIDKKKIIHGSVKFEPYIGFEDFEVSTIMHKKRAKLKLNSNSGASRFRTVLRDAYESDTSNFAGHYTFVYWGCGTSCQSSMAIDRQTGKIYNAPTASLGYEFRANSRMLIANPPDTNGYYDDCFYYKPVIYVFDERTKKFIELKPKF